MVITTTTSSLAVFSSPIFSLTVSLNSSTAVLTVFMLLKKTGCQQSAIILIFTVVNRSTRVPKKVVNRILKAMLGGFLNYFWPSSLSWANILHFLGRPVVTITIAVIATILLSIIKDYQHQHLGQIQRLLQMPPLSYRMYCWLENLFS